MLSKTTASPSTKAGVLVSSLSQDPDSPHLYAAVQRFTEHSGRGKENVCSYRSDNMETLLRTLSAIWLEKVKAEGEDGSVIAGSPFADDAKQGLEGSLNRVRRLKEMQKRRKEDKARGQNISVLLRESIDSIIKWNANE